MLTIFYRESYDSEALHPGSWSRESESVAALLGAIDKINYTNV